MPQGMDVTIVEWRNSYGMETEISLGSNLERVR